MDAGPYRSARVTEPRAAWSRWWLAVGLLLAAPMFALLVWALLPGFAFALVLLTLLALVAVVVPPFLWSLLRRERRQLRYTATALTLCSALFAALWAFAFVDRAPIEELERAGRAVERFHVEQGRWPTSLAELVPRYMPGVPAAHRLPRLFGSCGYYYGPVGLSADPSRPMLGWLDPNSGLVPNHYDFGRHRLAHADYFEAALPGGALPQRPTYGTLCIGR